MRNRSSTSLRSFGTLASFSVLLGLAQAGSVAAITGVCPDGSIFIVQKVSDIPCAEAKEVEPHDMPPLNPELLPRPYGWEQFQGRQDPNNPYNVVDSAPSLKLHGRGDVLSGLDDDRYSLPARDEAPAVQAMNHPEAAERFEEALRAAPAEALPQARPTFSPDELNDLAQIVALSQRRAWATFEAAEGRGLELRLAASRAFEPRLRAQWDSRGGLPQGPVVLFAASGFGNDPGDFYGNLTFVQRQAVFNPNRDEPREMGILAGGFGAVEPDSVVLGYAVLPYSIDLSQPVDIYWNDRVLETTLQPE